MIELSLVAHLGVWSHLLLLSVILRPALICAQPAPVAQKVKKITSAVANTINAVENTINAVANKINTAANTINAGAVFFFASFGYICTLLKYKVTLDISSNNNWQLFCLEFAADGVRFIRTCQLPKLLCQAFNC